MSTFYYNFDSGISRAAQWEEFLQQKSFTDDIIKSNQNRKIESAGTSNESGERTTDVINESTSQLSSVIQESGEGVIDAIDSMGENITNAIFQSAEQISDAIYNSTELLVGSIKNLSARFDWRMSQAVNQLEISNRLAIIPDFQKERRYFIERAIEFSQKGLLNPDLYEDALKNFLEAEKREGSDFSVLYSIGLIYLYQPNLLDLESAEDYFRRAGKYAMADESPTGTKISAEAFFQVGIACYIQGKCVEAAKASKTAFDLSSLLLGAGFNQAKFLAAADQVDDAIPVLRNVVKADRMYSLRAVQDGDLTTKPEVHLLLNQIREEAIDEANQLVLGFRKITHPDSKVLSILTEIEELIVKNTCSDALAAIDKLKKVLYNGILLNNFDLPMQVIWDVKTIVSTSENTMLESLIFSPDNKILGIVSIPHSFTLWDINGQEQICKFSGNYRSVCFSPDGSMLASGSWDKTVKLWPVNNETKLKEFTGHSANIASVCFSPDGSMLASGSEDNVIKLWRVSDGTEIKEFKNPGKNEFIGFDGVIWSLCFSPDGSMLASGSSVINLWRITDGTKMQEYKSYSDSCNVCFSPDGSMLAGAGNDSGITLWRVSDGTEIKEFKGHSNSINSLCFSPDGSMLASGSWDKTVKLWRVSDGTEIKEFKDYFAGPLVRFSPDGSMLATGSTSSDNEREIQVLLSRSNLILPLEGIIKLENKRLEEIRLEEIRLEEIRLEEIRKKDQEAAAIIKRNLKEKEEQIKELITLGLEWEMRAKKGGLADRTLHRKANYKLAYDSFQKAAELGSDEGKEKVTELSKFKN